MIRLKCQTAFSHCAKLAEPMTSLLYNMLRTDMLTKLKPSSPLRFHWSQEVILIKKMINSHFAMQFPVTTLQSTDYSSAAKTFGCWLSLTEHVSSFWHKQSHRSRNISHFPHFPTSVNAAFYWKVAIKVSNSKPVLIPGPPVWHIFFCGWRGCLTCSDPPGWWWGSCGGSSSCWGTCEWRERTPAAPQSALWREPRRPVCEAPKTGHPPRTPDRWPSRAAPAVGARIVLRASQTCRLNSWAAARAERRGPAPCTARTACRRCIYRRGTWCTEEEVEWSEIGSFTGAKKWFHFI